MGEEHSEQFVHTEQGTAWTSEFQLSDDSKAEDDKDGGRAQVSSVLSSEQAPNVTLCEPNMLKTSVQSQPSDKETHLSIQIPAVLEGILSFLTLLKLFVKLAFVLGFVDPNLCGDIVLESAPSNSGVTPIKQQKQQRRPYDRKKQYINPLEAETRWHGGKRVSTRIKSKPLEWWKGERMLYGRVHACRMEVQIEIGLPDEKGRFQILSIHSNKMKENSFLSVDVDLKELASKTKNFSGAELEGLVKSATSFALNRQVSAADLSREIVEDNIKVTMDDFMSALNEVKPAFGAAINTLEMCRLNGMLDCGERHAHIQRTVMTFVEQVSFKVREHLCSLASLKDLVAMVRQHWQQLLELKVVFHSLKLLCFQCFVQSSTMLSMHFNGHFREHRRV
ncbi:unnamed protein product [Sphagnum jensenii]|uniref:Vesicle-fusing ATPase n=1 Tax=Sphagnum jensenii TaxID=128206 RepID=A0ABP0WGT3_9BRYO